jgi:3-deoxy-D-manno-octulosonic-acid transferase
MALFVYNLLLTLLSPVLYLYLLYRRAKGKEDPGPAWAERWGRLPDTVRQDTRRPRFWVHAVSVGETMAAVPVLRELRRRFPEAFLLLSTTTIGGREVAMKQVPPADEVVYYPLDFPFTVSRALDAARPDAVLLMEWEIWPNFLTQAKRRGAKIAVLNGRVSDKGLRRGKRGAFFTAPGLAAVDLFAMQSEEDARRASLVGADTARVRTFGNTKFDESATPLTDAERSALRTDLGLPPDAPVWVCGSTRNAPEAGEPDEEAHVARAFAAARRQAGNLRLILAPRHRERADAAASALTAAGFTVGRRSRGEKATDFDCLLLDTFGELGRVYAVADVAFVGGSLVKQGGQSVFQPLAQGVPALFGPYMNNQRDIAALAKAAGVGWEVADADELGAQVVRLASLPPDEKRALSAKARALIERNQGVSARCVEAVAELLGQG